jgi:hypothetical protein
MTSAFLNETKEIYELILCYVQILKISAAKNKTSSFIQLFIFSIRMAIELG